jgi:gas vesicle protein
VLNSTINASNTAGNMTALVNQTAAEVGHNVSAVLNKTYDEVRSTLKELGQNLSNVGSEVGSEILNETEDTAKKVGMGTADVLSNISGEIKEGISGKKIGPEELTVLLVVAHKTDTRVLIILAGLIRGV